MKNEMECASCMYKNYPEHFTPCLGCKNNTIISCEAAVIEKPIWQQDRKNFLASDETTIYNNTYCIEEDGTMIPDKTVVPGVTFTREFFKFLKLMLGDLNEGGAIPFLCEYYAEGKYADKQTEDGWPILEDFDEMTYPFHLIIGPANNNGLNKLSVAQTPTTEGYKDNLLELLDMTEAGEDANIEDGILIGNLTAEQAYEYVSKKFDEYSKSWVDKFMN